MVILATKPHQESSILGKLRYTQWRLQMEQEKMSILYPRRATKFALMTLFVFLLRIPARAAFTTSDEYVSRAMQLLRNLFPELKNVQVSIRFSAPLRHKIP